MIKKIILCATLIFTMASCSVSKDLSGAYSMVNCKYEYNSIADLTVSGMDLSNGFSMAQIPQVTSLLSGKSKSIPVSFNLNVNVKNPNETPAILNGLQYIVNIDGIEFTTGAVNKALNIGAGKSENLPLTIGLDLAKLMETNSKDAVMDIARNLVGIGNKTSEVTLKLKPTFMVANVPVVSPVYIPVKFSFGGKK